MSTKIRIILIAVLISMVSVEVNYTAINFDKLSLIFFLISDVKVSTSPIFFRTLSQIVFRFITPKSGLYQKQFTKLETFLKSIKFKPVNSPTLFTDGKIYRISDVFLVKGVKKHCKIIVDMLVKKITANCGGVRYSATL